MRARSNLPAFPLSLSLSRKGRGNVLSKRHSFLARVFSRHVHHFLAAPGLGLRWLLAVKIDVQQRTRPAFIYLYSRQENTACKP